MQPRRRRDPASLDVGDQLPVSVLRWFESRELHIVVVVKELLMDLLSHSKARRDGQGAHNGPRQV